MAAKIFITICIQVVFIQTISCQILGKAFNSANISPSLIDGSASAIDMHFGPNEMALGPIAATEMAYGPRIAANHMAYGPRVAANEMINGPRIAANEMINGPRIAANEMAYGPRMAANEIAVANELASANMAANVLALDGLPLAGYGPGMPIDRVPSSGGNFPVTCSSRVAPTGITIVSENTIEGVLAVNGELPVLAAVSLQGSLPTTGSGSVTYGCGNGDVGIEGIGPAAAELSYEQRLANEIDLARLGRVGAGVL